MFYGLMFAWFYLVAIGILVLSLTHMYMGTSPGFALYLLLFVGIIVRTIQFVLVGLNLTRIGILGLGQVVHGSGMPLREYLWISPDVLYVIGFFLAGMLLTSPVLSVLMPLMTIIPIMVMETARLRYVSMLKEILEQIEDDE